MNKNLQYFLLHFSRFNKFLILVILQYPKVNNTSLFTNCNHWCTRRNILISELWSHHISLNCDFMLVTVDCGHYTVDSGKWTLESGKIEKWKIKSGQWTVDSGVWRMRQEVLTAPHLRYHFPDWPSLWWWLMSSKAAQSHQSHLVTTHIYLSLIGAGIGGLLFLLTILTLAAIIHFSDDNHVQQDTKYRPQDEEESEHWNGALSSLWHHRDWGWRGGENIMTS